MIHSQREKNGCHTENELSIFAHNVNGLLTKINNFYVQVDAAEFEIYLLTETRLNDSVFSHNLFPLNKFEVYR